MNLCFSHLLNKSPAANCIFLYKIVFTKTNCPFILLDHSIAFPVITFLLVITGLMFFLCFRVSNYFLKPAFIVYFDIFNLLSTHPTLKTTTCFALSLQVSLNIVPFFFQNSWFLVNTCCSLCSYMASAFYHTYLWLTLCKGCINLQNCMFNTKT